jgi:hypothetical protein
MIKQTYAKYDRKNKNSRQRDWYPDKDCQYDSSSEIQASQEIFRAEFGA